MAFLQKNTTTGQLAEEVYQEYLNPHPPQPTVEDFNLEMDYRVTMLEMIGGI